MSWARRHYELSSSLIANSHSRQSKCYSSPGHGMPTLHLAIFRHQIQSTCSAAARMNGPQCDMVLPTLIAGQCYHRLLPASVFASCVMVLSEIPPFSSVASTTVLRASTPFSISWPSSVVLSNCRPSSARCGSASILGIVVVTSFYTSTSSIQYSRLHSQLTLLDFRRLLKTPVSRKTAAPSHCLLSECLINLHLHYINISPTNSESYARLLMPPVCHGRRLYRHRMHAFETV